MRHLTYDISEEAYHAKPFDFYFSDMSCGAFDIETTGLSPDRCYVILIGFMKISDGVCRLHQYFADSLSEEADIIRAFLRDAEDTDVLITYNGRSFDIPFLEKRMSRYPDLSEKLDAVNARMEDMQIPFITGAVYDVRMRGQWSLKVIMSMMNDASYQDLDINQGMEAVYQWRHLYYDDDTPEEEKEKIIENLRKYCGMDAYAMTVVYRWLLNICREPK